MPLSLTETSVAQITSAVSEVCRFGVTITRSEGVVRIQIDSSDSVSYNELQAISALFGTTNIKIEGAAEDSYYGDVYPHVVLLVGPT